MLKGKVSHFMATPCWNLLYNNQRWANAPSRATNPSLPPNSASAKTNNKSASPKPTAPTHKSQSPRPCPWPPPIPNASFPGNPPSSPCPPTHTPNASSSASKNLRCHRGADASHQQATPAPKYTYPRASCFRGRCYRGRWWGVDVIFEAIIWSHDLKIGYWMPIFEIPPLGIGMAI